VEQFISCFACSMKRISKTQASLILGLYDLLPSQVCGKKILVMLEDAEFHISKIIITQLGFFLKKRVGSFHAEEQCTEVIFIGKRMIWHEVNIALMLSNATSPSYISLRMMRLLKSLLSL
jgi:hypothetical protein